MTVISQIPLYAGISPSSQSALCRESTLRVYRAGEVIVRAGDTGEFLFTISCGTVRIQSDSTSLPNNVIMGPREIFGEMSLISGSPISATIVATSSAEIFLTPSSTFHQLLAEDVRFLRAIVGVLTRRLRVRTSQDHQVPICAFIAFPAGYAGFFPKVIRQAVDRYVRVASSSDRVADSVDIPSMKQAIDTWRALHSDGVYLVFLSYADVSRLRETMRVGDVVLIVETRERVANGIPEFAQPNVDAATVRLGQAVGRPAQRDEVWSFCVTDTDIDVAVAEPYSGTLPTAIDILARWIVKRCVGIALGAGGARGFAHLGVLKALQSAHIPLDFLAGSSIGGIISIFYGMTLSVQRTYELARDSLGSNRIVREVAWLPRTSLFRGRRVRQNAERAGGDLMLRDLKRNARALATDLISGRQVVMDSGSVAIALQATASIPGVFPAVIHDDRCLVDGALISSIPVYLLNPGRCGIKIAVSIEPHLSAENPTLRNSLRRHLSGSFSIAHVIARSWELMGLSHAQNECKLADFVIRPKVGERSGLDFDALEHFSRAGEIAAQELISAIDSRVSALIKQRL